jgi:hypothetical protein
VSVHRNAPDRRRIVGVEPYKPDVPKRSFQLGELVTVGSKLVPAVVVSPDVRFMLVRGPRHPVIGVAMRQSGGWWEPAFFLPEDVRPRPEAGVA